MTAVLAFFASPLGRWLVIAALIAATAGALELHGRAHGFKEAMDEVHAENVASENRYLEIMAKRQKAFFDLGVAYNALAAQHEGDLEAAEKRHLAELDALRKEAPTYVPEKSHLCPDLPVGYILHRYNLAQYANDRDARAAAPSADAADAPAGISLSVLANTVDAEQASAYRACAERVKGWEQYATDVDTWAAKVNLILKGASP